MLQSNRKPSICTMKLAFLTLLLTLTSVRADIAQEPFGTTRAGESVERYTPTTLAEYEEHNGTVYFGCIIGRVANRISGGKFNLEGRGCRLALHPGRKTDSTRRTPSE